MINQAARVCGRWFFHFCIFSWMKLMMRISYGRRLSLWHIYVKALFSAANSSSHIYWYVVHCNADISVETNVQVKLIRQIIHYRELYRWAAASMQFYSYFNVHRAKQVIKLTIIWKNWCCKKVNNLLLLLDLNKKNIYPHITYVKSQPKKKSKKILEICMHNSIVVPL